MNAIGRSTVSGRPSACRCACTVSSEFHDEIPVSLTRGPAQLYTTCSTPAALAASATLRPCVITDFTHDGRAPFLRGGSTGLGKRPHRDRYACQRDELPRRPGVRRLDGTVHDDHSRSRIRRMITSLRRLWFRRQFGVVEVALAGPAGGVQLGGDTLWRTIS